MRDSMFKMLAVASATTALLAACGGGDDPAPAPAPTPVAVGDTVALTASGSLISFNRAAPGTMVGSIAVSNLNAGETLLGIDYRPKDGLLYGVGTLGNIYTIDPSTGVATFKAALKADTTTVVGGVTGDTTDPFVELSGDDFAVDFNPVVDRLRVISNSGQDLRINVDNGNTFTDGVITLTGGSPSVTAAAYTNAFFGTATTRLIDLDASVGQIYLQDPPAAGTLGVIGMPLGVTGTQVNGFDIDGRSNTGYAALTVGGTSNLYSVNITTGVATALGAIPGGESIRGLALQQPAGPSVLGLTTDNKLVAFDPRVPNTLSAPLAITGLGAGETVVGVDVRPQDGLLYALTNNAGAAKLYTVDTSTGAATFVAALVDAASAPITLSGTVFSVDFNPAADRLRVVSDTGQNLRIVVADVPAMSLLKGRTFIDTALTRTGDAPTVLASAYTNNFAGTTSTKLFNLEANNDVLTEQGQVVPPGPNGGVLTNVGALGIDISGTAAFDIASDGNGLALAALRTGGTGPFVLYSVNLTTGAATLYSNTTSAAGTNGTADLNRIGGASGPALLDIAIKF